MKKMMLIGMVVVMMLGLVGCNSEEKEIVEKIQSEEAEGFVPTQIEEENQEVADIVEEVIDTENLQKYYDATQFVGTPRLEELSVSQYSDVTCLLMGGYLLEIAKDDSLVDGQVYQAIVIDNNTPTDKCDDTCVYIFTE
jgi:hypothetical protein